MHLEDLDTGSEARVETYLAKIKAIKRVGKIIIDFLAQIEDFQKKLWLKKKFVVETNFYPDYILWIDTDEKQYISFIDPKGLIHIGPDDPKIEFYKTIKDLEARLAPTSSGKTIVLNSFIMSGTSPMQLSQRWNMERPAREAKNVYTLDSPDCVELMIDKILQY